MTFTTSFSLIAIYIVLLGLCMIVAIAAGSHLFRSGRRLMRDRRAVTALEYGLIAALIAVVIIGSVSTLGTRLSASFSTVSSSMIKASK